jgi:hypothetical protein
MKEEKAEDRLLLPLLPFGLVRLMPTTFIPLYSYA